MKILSFFEGFPAFGGGIVSFYKPKTRILCLEIRTKRISLHPRILCLEISHSLRFSLIFYFLLLNFYFLFPASAWYEPYGSYLWADQVDTLRPAMNQAQDQWFKSPAGDDGYKYIDDVVIDLDTTYLYTTAGNQYQGWLANDFNTSNIIDSVRLVIKARSTATSGDPQITFGREVWDGEMWGICGEGGGAKTITLTSTYDSNWTQTWAVDPCYPGDPWTTDLLNDDYKAWFFKNSNMGSIPDSFGLMADSATENLTANYVDACRFQVGSVGGNLTNIRLKVDDITPNGSIKFAIYTDTTVGGNNYARTKLWADDVGQTIVNGWNLVSTAGISLSANTYYWLCSKMSTTNTVQWKGGPTGEHRWDAEAYTATWRDTIAVNSWDGTNTKKHRYIGVYITTTLPQNRVTQSFIVVYSHAVAVAKKQVGGLVQDEDNKGVAEGGIVK